jgi:hypothetical protein
MNGGGGSAVADSYTASLSTWPAKEQSPPAWGNAIARLYVAGPAALAVTAPDLPLKARVNDTKPRRSRHFQFRSGRVPEVVVLYGSYFWFSSDPKNEEEGTRPTAPITRVA